MLVFILFPLVLAGIFAAYFPETKGLSLEEVGELFEDGVVDNVTEGLDIENVHSNEARVPSKEC